MKYNVLSMSAIALSLFSLNALAADPVSAPAPTPATPVAAHTHVHASAKTPALKKAKAKATDEDPNRAETLKEFPQYNYPVVTVSPVEVENTKVTEKIVPITDDQKAPAETLQ